MARESPYITGGHCSLWFPTKDRFQTEGGFALCGQESRSAFVALGKGPLRR